MNIAMDPKEPKEKKGFNEYEVKEALETLMRAKDIEANKALMAAVQKLANKKQGHIRSIQDIKDKSKQMSQPEEDTEEV